MFSSIWFSNLKKRIDFVCHYSYEITAALKNPSTKDSLSIARYLSEHIIDSPDEYNCRLNGPELSHNRLFALNDKESLDSLRFDINPKRKTVLRDDVPIFTVK